MRVRHLWKPQPRLLEFLFHRPLWPILSWCIFVQLGLHPMVDIWQSWVCYRWSKGTWRSQSYSSLAPQSICSLFVACTMELLRHLSRVCIPTCSFEFRWIQEPPVSKDIHGPSELSLRSFSRQGQLRLMGLRHVREEWTTRKAHLRSLCLGLLPPDVYSQAKWCHHLRILRHSKGR